VLAAALASAVSQAALLLYPTRRRTHQEAGHDAAL